MHWIEKFRREYRRQDGGTGISQEEMAKLVRKCKIGKKQVGCSWQLIDILECGGITAPGIAAMIVKVCGGTAEQFDSIVDEIWRGKWKPGMKADFYYKIAEEPHEFVCAPKEPKKEKPKVEKPKEPKKEKPKVEKPKEKKPHEDKCKSVVQIGRDGIEIMRFASVNEAARHANVNISSVSQRCNRIISEKTDEFKMAKCTWRFAEDWDKMTENQRAEEMRFARKRRREK